MKKVLLALTVVAYLATASSCAKNICEGGTYDGEGITEITGLSASFPGAKASAKSSCEAGGGEWK